MEKDILVTGVSGFVGKHLAREIKARGHKAYGVGREESPNPELESVLEKYFKADLTNMQDVAKLPLEEIDVVINLAGLASARDSFKDPEKYLKINVDVATVIAKEIVARKPSIRFIAISTGAVYGSNQPMPLTESSVLVTQGSPYAQSKILMEEALNKIEGLDCVLVRPFNHIGPGQEPGFLVPDLYQKISLAIQNAESVKVGDLNTKRDYTDVRDVVKAYVNLAEADSLEHKLYNVCSGKSLTGEAILNTLLEAMDASGKIKIEQDQALIRPNDPKDLYGSNERIIKVNSWHPTIALEQTIRDFVTSKNKG
jgi:GDP-4-dehydro-6-deoxy-D-mannose reductase